MFAYYNSIFCAVNACESTPHTVDLVYSSGVWSATVAAATAAIATTYSVVSFFLVVLLPHAHTPYISAYYLLCTTCLCKNGCKSTPFDIGLCAIATAPHSTIELNLLQCSFPPLTSIFFSIIDIYTYIHSLVRSFVGSITTLGMQ